jgi:hypothetical protein
MEKYPMMKAALLLFENLGGYYADAFSQCNIRKH